MKINKKRWMQIHTYLSLFFLPAALIYALTGVLYIFEIRQDSGAKILEFELESMPKNGEEQAFILHILQENNLKIPSDIAIKKVRNNKMMGNTYYNAMLTKNKADKPILRVTQRNLYGVLMLMHKSSGTKHEVFGLQLSVFDWIAIGFGISLVIFYFSGLIVTSFCRNDRVVSFGVLGMGAVLTGLAVYLSV